MNLHDHRNPLWIDFFHKETFQLTKAHGTNGMKNDSNLRPFGFPRGHLLTLLGCILYDYPSSIGRKVKQRSSIQFNIIWELLSANEINFTEELQWVWFYSVQYEEALTRLLKRLCVSGPWNISLEKYTRPFSLTRSFKLVK